MKRLKKLMAVLSISAMILLSGIIIQDNKALPAPGICIYIGCEGGPQNCFEGQAGMEIDVPGIGKVTLSGKIYCYQGSSQSN